MLLQSTAKDGHFLGMNFDERSRIRTILAYGAWRWWSMHEMRNTIVSMILKARECQMSAWFQLLVVGFNLNDTTVHDRIRDYFWLTHSSHV